MNSNTKKHLINFIEAVENLTSATLVTIGMETASEIINTCNQLKLALERDETILEVK